MCNTSNRIISKIIVNRLRIKLDEVVDTIQSAFIPGCKITDNIIIGYECTHKIRLQKGKVNGFTGLKLDMSKANDRLEY